VFTQFIAIYALAFAEPFFRQRAGGVLSALGFGIEAWGAKNGWSLHIGRVTAAFNTVARAASRKEQQKQRQANTK